MAALLGAAPAWASETVTYSYDALGRLVSSTHAGTVNSGLNQAYSYDAAGNRTNASVTGSIFNSLTRVIVVPLGGARVMPITKLH